MKIGMQTGQQNCPFDDLRRARRFADDHGYAWISVWDHFHEAPYVDGQSVTYETVAAYSTLAADTQHARLGCLVFTPGYRPPSLLAKMITTLDHISHGRANLGLGAGWHSAEYTAYGYEYGSNPERLDMLEESMQIVQSMLSKERTSFQGKHFTVTDAINNPKPVQDKLPVWVGGTGRMRTLRIAARYADGWNAAYIAPEDFTDLNQVLDGWCDKEGRDPAAIERSINLGFYMGANEAEAAELRAQFSDNWKGHKRPVQRGMLMGTASEVVDQLGTYADAGAENVNIAIRPPFNWDALQKFTEDVMPKFV